MSLALSTPVHFTAFPYDPPYDIQNDLMHHLYTAIEHKQVSIIESPTGTGKTLSLLCASLTWLRDHRLRAIKGGHDPDDDDWVTAQAQDRLRRQLLAEEEEYEQTLRKARQRELFQKARVLKRQKPDHLEQVDMNDDGDDAFLPEHEEEDDHNLSPAVRALMKKFQNPIISDTPDPVCTKIYYASRTHSQLTQVLPELVKLKLLRPVTTVPVTAQPSSSNLKRSLDDDEPTTPFYIPRFLSLGSRKQLCIHEKLRQSRRDLDEGCRELLEEKKDKRCPYLASPEQLVDFRDQILSYPKDIEDLATAGKQANTCPYFASRRAIPQAELITLPYNLLLQPAAREALGIDLTDHIVVIDEAHNLPSTLLSLSTVSLPLTVLDPSLDQLEAYVNRFKTRLSPVNLLTLKRLAVFLVALRASLVQAKPGTSEVTDVSSFTTRLGPKAASINLLDIVTHLKKTKLAQKMAHYSDKVTKVDVQSDKGKVPPLYAVEAFLLALTGKNEDGRVTFSVGSSGQAEVKYQLLNPAPSLAHVVESARSVILAGGTMSPMSEISSQLFPQLVSSERLTTFSCGHIIPSSNLRALVVPHGPRGTLLEFTAANQTKPDLVTELGQILVNFAACVVKGLVVFFPSYKFLNTCRDQWSRGGVLDRMESKKKLFFEPEETNQVEATLEAYAQAISAESNRGSKGGAMLLAVIGAKLSEGLNFTDDLARAVVIIGMPFANLGSVELKERLDYFRKTHPSTDGRDSGAELYENMCMNAVNQSIGRAIRHRADWSGLVLIDRRYTSARIQAKLPKWIGEGLTVTNTFGEAMKQLGAFYRSKRQVG